MVFSVLFFLFSFYLLVCDKFGKKYDLFSLLGTGRNLLGAWGQCKRSFFIALKHGADTFFAVSSHGLDTFSPYLESSEKIFTEKNAAAAIFFTEIADRD